LKEGREYFVDIILNYTRKQNSFGKEREKRLKREGKEGRHERKRDHIVTT